MTQYYDVVLGLIPLALVGVSGSLAVTGMSLTSAIPVAGVVAIAVMAHAMFVNGPTDEAVASAGTPASAPAGTATTAPAANTAD